MARIYAGSLEFDLLRAILNCAPLVENRLGENGSQELLRAILKSGGQWRRQQRYLGASQRARLLRARVRHESLPLDGVEGQQRTSQRQRQQRLQWCQRE